MKTEHGYEVGDTVDLDIDLLFPPTLWQRLVRWWRGPVPSMTFVVTEVSDSVSYELKRD